MDSVTMYLYLRKNVSHFPFLRLFYGQLCNFSVMLSNFLHCLIEIMIFLHFVNMIFLKLVLILLCLHFGKVVTALVVVVTLSGFQKIVISAQVLCYAITFLTLIL